MIPTILVAIGIAAAVVTRLWLPARDRISTAATTITSVVVAFAVGLTVAALIDGTVGDILAFVIAGAAALGVVQVSAWGVDTLRARRREKGKPLPVPILDRLENAFEKRANPDKRYNIRLLVIRCIKRIVDVRVTGLAAEMSYYALISLVPLITAFGAALGSLERFVGEERVEQIENVVVAQITRVFSNQLTADVLAPLVEGLLSQERAGVAIGGTVIALFLASRMFRAAIRALDGAYRVADRRTLVAQFSLGLALALGAVLTLIVLLSMLVIGPLLGGGEEIAALLGLSDFFSTSWSVLRWPAVIAVAGSYLVLLYRFGPHVENRWFQCIPGAIASTAGLLLVAVGFQVYLANAGPTVPELDAAGQSVAIAVQTLGAILAAVIWLWVSSIVILSGGVLNAELQRMRGVLPRQPRPV